MALNSNKSGFSLEDVFNDRSINGTNKGMGEYPHTDADTHTHEATHKHTQVNEPVAKVFKKKRVQLLTYESLIEEMDEYAAKRGVPRVAVFEVAMRKFLDEVNKAK